MQQFQCSRSTEFYASSSGSPSKVPFGEVQTLVNLGSIHVASPGAPMVVITDSEAGKKWAENPEALAKLVDLGMQLTKAAGGDAANRPSTGGPAAAPADGSGPESADDDIVLSKELLRFLRKYLTHPEVAIPYLNGIAQASTPLEVEKQIETFYEKLTDNPLMDRDTVFLCKHFIARLLEYAPLELLNAPRSGLTVENIIRRLKKHYIEVDKVKAQHRKVK